MYAEFVSTALVADDGEPSTSEELLERVVTCRARMLRSAGRLDQPAEERLAREVEYDTALIRLCTALDIAADPSRFAHPHQERARLEQALADAGVPMTREMA